MNKTDQAWVSVVKKGASLQEICQSSAAAISGECQMAEDKSIEASEKKYLGQIKAIAKEYIRDDLSAAEAVQSLKLWTGDLEESIDRYKNSEGGIAITQLFAGILKGIGDFQRAEKIMQEEVTGVTSPISSTPVSGTPSR